MYGGLAFGWGAYGQGFLPGGTGGRKGYASLSDVGAFPNVGDMLYLVATFYSDAGETTPADPTSVTLSIRDPSGAVTDVSADVIHDDEGGFHYDWTPLVPGWHEFSWVGTGDVQVVKQESIYVQLGLGAPQLYFYLSPDQLKSTLEMTGTNFADPDIALAIGAASRAVDTITGRRFWLDADANKVRYYTPRSYRLLQIDDLVAMTSVAIDRSGTGTFSEAWTIGTDYVLEPFNAPQEQPARPYETLRVRYLSGRWLPTYIEQSVRVTGQFGWTAVPDDVTAATTILAAKLVRRQREAPFGIVMAGGIDSGVAMRIARTDPDVFTLLHDYTRHEPFV